MSKYNSRIGSILPKTGEELFANNPRAFANYTLNINLLEGGSQESYTSEQSLRYSLNEGNLLSNKLLLYKLYKGVNSSAN